MKYELIFAGFGGQGIMYMGKVLSYAAMLQEKHVMFIPAYGSEMRGGTANCSVIISDEGIYAPVVAHPMALVAMNTPSLIKFQSEVKENGTIIINSSTTDNTLIGEGLNVIEIDANQIAADLGNEKIMNMVVLGAFLKISNCVSLDSVIAALKKTLPERHHHMLPLNKQALEMGMAAVN